MTQIKRCGTRDDFIFGFELHRCKPRHEAWCPEHGDDDEADAVDVFANSFEEAAEKWAEKHDRSSADYAIVSDEESPVVHVRCPDGSVHRLRVSGEAIPHYTAELIE